MSSDLVIILPDGSERHLAPKSTGADLAADIGGRAAREALIAVADGIQIDLDTALPNNSQVSLIFGNSDRKSKARSFGSLTFKFTSFKSLTLRLISFSRARAIFDRSWAVSFSKFSASIASVYRKPGNRICNKFSQRVAIAGLEGKLALSIRLMPPTS